MKEKVKGFIAGTITTVLITSTVFAAPVGKTIKAYFNGIKIYIDGDKIIPKDGNGKVVEPFIYDGTTYLPVRAVSEALGKQVAWDEKVNTVYIGHKLEEVVVSTADDFVKSIGSNKKIILNPGVYDLSNVDQSIELQAGVTWEDVTDGKELNIRNISNLIIEGPSEGKTEILVKPRFSQIMDFENVSNVTIRNITAGHTPAEYMCDAGVLNFQSSKDIKIENCELYGCGSIGLSLNEVERLNMSNSNINHCSLRAVQIYDSNDINLKGSKIINHEAYSNIFYIRGSKDVLIEECEMSGNKNFGWDFMEVTDKSNVVLNKCKITDNSQASKDSEQKFDKTCVFKTIDFIGICDSSILVKDTEFSNNVCDYLTDNETAVTFDNCKFSNNIWSE